MAHGGYQKRRVSQRKPATAHRSSSRALAVDMKSKPKSKSNSLKRQIRSTERLLRKDTRPDVKEALEKKLEGLKKQEDNISRLAVERKIFLRYRRIKFFERRKIERSIRRLEKQQRASSGQPQEAEIAEQLFKLKEDLEYVRFFPKSEKYVSLFKGDDDTGIIDKRNNLRKQIKANIIAAAASGKDLEETGSEDDGLLDVSEDDFFLTGSSSDEDADNEWTDNSTREQASSASGKATSGMSSDERNQRQISARVLMPPPRPSKNSSSGHSKSEGTSKNSHSGHGKSRYEGTSKSSNLDHGKSRYESAPKKKPYARRAELSTSSNTSNSYDRPSFKKKRPLDPHTGNSSNLSSNSDAQKPRRKRRPKKKKQQA